MAEDLKQFIKEEGKKTRKHFDVISEGLKGEMQQVAEGVDTNTQQLKRIESRVENLEPMKDDFVAIKTTLEAVNLPALKQRILTLEGRVTTLESKSD